MLDRLYSKSRFRCAADLLIQRWHLPVILLLVFGLARSAQISFAIPVDADRATPALVFGAFQTSGLGALWRWHATQDNWLLSAILPQLPLYALLGTPEWLPALTGWFAFVIVCGTAGLLASLAIGRPGGARIGMLLAGVLLFASPLSLGRIGFLSHPASHDITLAWCLLALAPLMVVLRGGSPSWLALASILLLGAAVSDPWAKASFVLPVDLASVCLFASATGLRRRALLVMLSTAPAWLAGGHLFGILPGLPGTRFDTVPIGSVPDHFGMGLGAVSILLDLLPGIDPLTHRWARLLDLVMIAAVSALIAGTVWRMIRRATPERSFLLLVCLLSMAATMAAFSLSVMATGFDMARLLCNVAVLFPLVLAAVSAGGPVAVGRIAAASGLLIVLAGLSLDGHDAVQAAEAARTRRLFSFLAAHGLAYGYGGYWSSEANASRLVSGGRVTIRPLAALGPAVAQPRDGQVFDSWYRPEDAPAGSKTRFFVAIRDQELCEDDAACVALAERSFGLPDRRLVWEDHPILIWDHPIIPATPAPGIAADAPELVPGSTVPVNTATGKRLLWAGWAGLGADGAWTVARSAGLMLRLPVGVGAVCFRLRASGRHDRPLQPVTLREGSQTLASWAVAAGEPRSYCASRVSVGPVFLSFDRPLPPRDNQRLLPGIQLSEIAAR